MAIAKENTLGAAVQPVLSPHPRADLTQTRLFSVEGFTTCYACMKAGLFCNYHCNITLFVFKMFYSLQRQRELETNTLQHPPKISQKTNVLPRHPNWSHNWRQKQHDKHFCKTPALHFSNKVTTDSMTKGTSMSQHPTLWKVHMAPQNASEGLHTDPTISW